MKSEIITLIIGTVLGATIAFCYGLLDKKIEFKKEKNNAMICLKIELTRINTKGHLCLLCQTQHIPEFSKLEFFVNNDYLDRLFIYLSNRNT